MITTTEQDLIEEAEEIARQAAEADEIEAEEAAEKAKTTNARKVIVMIRDRKLQTLGQIVGQLIGAGYGDDILADYEGGHRPASYPASEVILDIEANYLF